jgi:PKD repeat protein
VVPLPTAGFSATPLSGNSPLLVTFTNNSSGATSYLWNFGDTLKSTSTKQSDSFRYKTNGTFKVRYQVYNGTCWGEKDSSLVVNLTSVNDVVNGITAKIGLYPNPTNANLTININGNYQPKSISVMDINGKVMPIEMPALNKNSNSNGIMNINLNVESLPQGFYQILMTDGVNNSTLKFIKN